MLGGSPCGGLREGGTSTHDAFPPTLLACDDEGNGGNEVQSFGGMGGTWVKECRRGASEAGG